MNTDSWSTLLKRAADLMNEHGDIGRTQIKQLLDDRRTDRLESSENSEYQTDTERQTGDNKPPTPPESASISAQEPKTEPELSITEPATDPMPTSVVVDADVFVADFLCGSDTDARQAIEILWTHSWMTLFASNTLLTDAQALIATLATDQLAREWRAHMTDWCSIVTHPPDDHPALATAYRGGAMHILSFNDQLRSVQAGASLRGQFPVSVRDPAAYTAVFSPDRLYNATVSDTDTDTDTDTYPGPDRGSRMQ